MDEKRRDMLKITALGGLAAGAAALSSSASAQASAAESTLERVRRTGELRVSILAGEAPFYVKNLSEGTWEGAGMLMAEDIAKALDVKLTILEGSTANSIADVQTGKADLAFPFNQSPQRALAVRFTDTIYTQGIVYVSGSNVAGTKWEDLNKPDTKIATVIGGLADTLSRRYCPNAETTAYKTRDDAIVAAQAGRADVFVVAMMQGMGIRAKFPALSKITLLEQPQLNLESCMAIPKGADYEWRDFLNAWIKSVRGSRQTTEWILQGFEKIGLKRDDIPDDVRARL
ncbi:transporter substrate-binding domain-containing protein [Ensifer sp. ENS05]|uniref:transporter substrate-binding domain-containing protein n=1 Tax=Ensifer sp. ENS05 TaxID=2769277 RepID=UPI0017855A9C|nr:transporter substrate-binding domain-containing protein [Ensifer sp. ENS05]MBD9597318.1 transporter substrate-binding domain-containing protein [Ensifer sp. ENS05]